MPQVAINGTPEEIIAVLRGLTSSPELAQQVAQLLKNTEKIMATEADFQAQLSRIDATTTASAAAAAAIKTNIDALKAEIANAGLSKEQEASILAKLTASGDTAEALSTFLTAIASPGTPEPTPVLVPEPIPDPAG